MSSSDAAKTVLITGATGTTGRAAVRETGGNVVLNLSQRSAHREATSNSSPDTYISEQVFNWSGVGVIHLRPTMFQEWLLYRWMLPYLQHGVLRMSAGQGTSSPVAAADQGRAIAALLLHSDDHLGTTIPLSGPAEMDHEQMAAIERLTGQRPMTVGEFARAHAGVLNGVSG